MKAFKPTLNASNSRGVMPGSGSPGRVPLLTRHRSDRQSHRPDDGQRGEENGKTARHQSSTTSTPCMNSWPAPHSFEHSKI